MRFSDFNLEPSLLNAIQQVKWEECTAVQEHVIPHVMSGKDVAGLAQTGTGKTGAFLVPLMDRILKKSFVDWKIKNFVLILVPTRELAEQVLSVVIDLGSHCGLRGVSVYGGTAYDKQKAGIASGCEFIVATPGRLIDLYKDHQIDLRQCRAIVFDEADRMFDMGFKDDMKYILARVPNDRQFLVFSATLNFEVLNTAYQFGANPIEFNISKDQAKAENVADTLFHIGQNDKPAYLLSILKKANPKQAIVFSNFKHNVSRLSRFLCDNGIPAVGISSLLTQPQRNRVMEQFKQENESNVLVATDVAARGLDVKGVDLVINYDLPDDAETYVHRIGRTGRAGATGSAVSLVSDMDVDALNRIEAFVKYKINTGWLEDSEIVRDHAPLLKDSPDSASGPRKSSSERFSRRGPRGERGGERGGNRGGERRERRGDGSSVDQQRGDQRNGEPQGERRPPRDSRRNHDDSRAPNRDTRRQSPGSSSGSSGNGNTSQSQSSHSHSSYSRNSRSPNSNGPNQNRSRSHGKNHGSSAQNQNPKANTRPPSPSKSEKGQGQAAGQAKSAASVGAKITGFFKKLFKTQS